MVFLKKIIKKFLNLFGWELVKKRRPSRSNPYGKIDLKTLNCINEASGILHLGAHRGTEAEVYNWFGKSVVWVEAYPEIYEDLKNNLMFYSNQTPLLGLISDVNDEEIDFNISNHDAACSSMYNFTDEIKKSSLWSNRNFEMVKTIKLKTITLDKLLSNNNINPKNFNHWIIDLQGAELKALKGSSEAIKYCKSIYVEVSEKEFYKDGAKWDEINHWLNKKNFFSEKSPSSDHEDVLFVKR